MFSVILWFSFVDMIFFYFNLVNIFIDFLSCLGFLPQIVPFNVMGNTWFYNYCIINWLIFKDFIFQLVHSTTSISICIETNIFGRIEWLFELLCSSFKVGCCLLIFLRFNYMIISKSIADLKTFELLVLYTLSLLKKA